MSAQKTARAFILISTDLGAEKEVARSLRDTEHVTQVHVVYGVYDIVAKIEADTPDDLKNTISMKIRRLKNVKSTQTMPVVES